MKNRIDIVVPKLGMDTTEAVVIRWLVSEGDNAEIGTPLVELETEKVNFEFESEAAGKIAEIVQPTGAVVPVGGILAVLETE